MMRVHSAALAMGLAALLAPAPPAPAGQPADPAPPTPPAPATPAAPASPPPPEPRAPSIDELPPSLKLGLRASLVRTRLPCNPVVVLVSDERSYLAAIAAWNYETGVRYPVLIDDGSWPAHQAIARFVHAYKPRRVVRWTAPEGPGAPAWPAEAAARQGMLLRVAARPWLATPPEPNQSVLDALAARWTQLQYVPPGVVVTSVDDPAWTAAVALAAGRGQPLAFTTAPGDPGGYMNPADAAALAKRLEGIAEATGRSWAALGDDLDAITLCLNCSTKVFLGEKDQRGMFSLTDWIGRKAGDGDTPGRPRWAWAGQVIGNQWRSAYAAMSALFLTTDSAWLFDGYDSTMPWHTFDATEAATVLEKAGIRTLVDDDDHRSIAAWRRRAAGSRAPQGAGGGLDAGLVLINSSGNPDFFNLQPGEGRPADAPVLRRPAVVHMVHSWSASVPSDVNTVAGAWLQRGAYAYVGSVHEPFLQAFVPTPRLAMRLAAGLPLGAAARLDNGEPWKLSILGDPLITLGKTGPTPDRPLPLDGARDLQEELAAALPRQGQRDYVKAFTALRLMGRAGDAADLLRAVLAQERDRLTPEAALAALPSAYFAADLDTFLAAYSAAHSRLATEEMVAEGGLWDARDMLWHALWPAMGTLTRDQAQMLGMNLRAGSLVRDATEAYSAITTAINKEAAADVIARALRQAQSQSDRQKIQQIGK